MIVLFIFLQMEKDPRETELNSMIKGYVYLSDKDKYFVYLCYI